MAKNTDKQIEFTLPSLPASMNQMYSINFYERHMYLKPEVRTWKSYIKFFIPLWRPDGFSTNNQNNRITIDVDLFYDEYFKNGKLKKVDSQNFLKVLIDAVSEKIGIGDHFFKKGSWITHHSTTERKANVRLSWYAVAQTT